MSKTPSVALVTVDAARELDEDLAPLAEALHRLDVEVSLPSWDNDEVQWTSFDIAVLRSTWDYVDRLPEFLGWAERVGKSIRLHNPVSVVRWNTNKTYLRDLERAGVPIIPSAFFAPGESVHVPTAGEFVVKPSVGAGSRGAKRFAAQQQAAAAAHAARLQGEGATVLLQPYLASVDDHGETALLFIRGEFSHAIRKGPLLALDTADVEGLFARESITPRVPSDAELAVGRAALAAIPGGAPLYARVDLIHDANGAPRVLELELTEPSMFFDHAAGSADAYAAAIVAAARET
jgi:hypothetical protein